MAGEESIGGVSVSVVVDTSDIGSASAIIKAGTDKIATSMDAVDHAMAEVAAQSTRTSTSFVRAGQAAQEGSQGAQAFGRGVLELSRGIEDFTTGGPIGILNNIPGIFTNMASAAGIAGASLGIATAGVSLLATGAFILYRQWDNVTSLWETKNPFPASSDHLQNMQDRLKDVGKEIDKLKELDSLDNTQLARANTLLAERDKLEKEITAEKERQNKLESFLKGKTAEETARGSEFTAAVGEDRPQFIKDVKAAMDKEAEDDIRSQKARTRDKIAAFDRTGATQEEKDAFREKELNASEDYEKFMREGDRTKLAEDLTIRLGEGDKKARERLEGLMKGGTGVVIGGEGFAARLGQKDKERKEKEEKEKAKEEEKRLAPSYEEGLREKAAAEAAAKAGDAAHKQGVAETKAEKDERKKREDENKTANADFLRDEKDLAGLKEKGGDLNDKLRQLMNPEAQGKSLGLDQYESSIKSQTGETEDQKRLHAINETLKDIKKNGEQVKTIGVKRRGG